MSFDGFYISIHSLRMEGDAVYLADPVAIEEFQSTPSVWRETAQSIAINSDYKISIHSLRMEGDADAEAEARGEGDFNPLPPYGGRHFPEQKQDSNGVFQSTPSVWRETALRRSCTCQR